MYADAVKKNGNIMIGGMITLIYEHFMRAPIEHPASADLVKVRGVGIPTSTLRRIFLSWGEWIGRMTPMMYFGGMGQMRGASAPSLG